MKQTISFCVAVTVFFFTMFACANELSHPYELWYSDPATQWQEALPVGNGSMGAMVFGGVQQEKIRLLKKKHPQIRESRWKKYEIHEIRLEKHENHEIL